MYKNGVLVRLHILYILQRKIYRFPVLDLDLLKMMHAMPAVIDIPRHSPPNNTPIVTPMLLPFKCIH